MLLYEGNYFLEASGISSFSLCFSLPKQILIMSHQENVVFFTKKLGKKTFFVALLTPCST
jgi:hypothetical protein